jgi:uncharacterized repeat protein (TIGR01451 family)
MKKNILLLLTMSLFSMTIYAQNLSNHAVIYPEITITPELQQQKNSFNYSPPQNYQFSLPSCTTLTPICTAPGQYYSLVTSANAPAAQTLNPNNIYGCLGTTPNPIWYYIRVEQSGTIALNLNAASDIDYALWGPFNSVAAAEAGCNNYLPPINCSYSASNNEFPIIQNAQAGEVYVFLITNFANIIQTTTLTQIGGTGRMGCDGYSSINGVSLSDNNVNCINDNADSYLGGIYIQSNRGYAITDSLGRYSIVADSGSYTVNQIIPTYLQPLIDQTCNTGYTVNFNTIAVDSFGFDFFNEVLDCPYLTVDISSNMRRRCFRNNTVVEYCNEGFADANNVNVYVELPQYVHLISASQPYTIDTSGVYVFNIGNLAQGQCGSIQIVDSVACVNGILGTVQCSRAWITPANSCVNDSTQTGPWDRSSVSVNGQCINDSLAQFTITNTGSSSNGNMTGPSEYRIYIDGVLVYTGTFQLGGGSTETIQFPATGGTIRLEADQRPGHPGNSRPNDVLQGCGDSTNTSLLNNWLNFNAQSTDDGDVTIEEDCLPILDSYDPNDKQVSPSGVGQNHIVEPNTTLDYTIRFQNTGNAPAYRVIIRDTLSNDFDISSLQVGVSSHNYDFYLSGTNQPILIFEYNNINLPDSASNPTGSQGFIKFKIAPNSNTPLGTIIENKAAIYFDFNEPIITNTAWITIDEIPLGPPLIISIVSGTENSSDINDVKIFPNPTDNFVNVQVSNKSEFSTLNVYDLNGRLVKQKQLVDDFSIISLEDLPAGIYTMQILNDKKIKIFKIVKNK